jgi:hypothetical protein
VDELGSGTSQIGTLMDTETLLDFLKDRHALDAVARAVVTGERGLGSAQDRMADDVASLMINRLAAAEVPGHRCVAHLDWNAPRRRQSIEQRYGRGLLEALIRRTDKHLAHAALVALTDG